MSQALRDLHDIYSKVNGLWNLFREFDFTKLQRAKIVKDISELEGIGKKQEFLGIPKSVGTYAIYGYFLNSTGKIIGEIRPFNEAFSPLLDQCGVSTKLREIILSVINCQKMSDIRAIVLFAIRRHAITPSQVFVYKSEIHEMINDSLVAYGKFLFGSECQNVAHLIEMVTGNE